MVTFGGAAVLAMALSAFGSAHAQGRTGAAAMEATRKRPEAAGKIRTSMMLALVFMEALTLFVFAIVFVLAGRVTPEIAVFAAIAVVSMALAATGSALAQSRTAVAAMESVWQEPPESGDTQTSMMLGLVFMEALTLFVFAIVFVLAGMVDATRVVFASTAVAAMALAASGSAAAQGRTAARAMEATWKQPAAASETRTSMMLSLVFMEALTLFVFAIVFVLSGRAVTQAANLFGAASVVAIALAAVGSALAQGRASSAAMEATWLQPEAAGDIRTSMMLALVFMEALTLFVFAIIFVLSGMIV
jgi:F-type H+-transporting ATPase subunit c